MSLEEKARDAEVKAGEIRQAADKIIEICGAVQEKRRIGTKEYERTPEQKQDMIQDYQAEKALLQSLVEEMP